MKRKLAGLALIIAAISLCVYVHTQNSIKHASDPLPIMTGSAIGGPFTLVDHSGNEVTQDQYQGKYLLVFFGFANCPAICPTELDKIAAVLNQLDADIRQNVQTLFITTDPERDTPDVMKAYVSQFHPEIVGLTGSVDQVTDVMSTWRVYAEKIEMEGMDGYMMNHSAYTYLMNPQLQLLDVFKMEDEAEMITTRVTRRLSAK